MSLKAGESIDVEGDGKNDTSKVARYLIQVTSQVYSSFEELTR
jgi:hypothetical protein